MRNLVYVVLLAGLVGLAGLATHPDFAFAQGNQWGTSVKGQVVFAGANIPKLPDLMVTKDQAHCLSKGPVPNEEWVINAGNKGIKNVFVWITKPDGTKPPIHADLAQIKEKNVNLDQPVCAFVPHSMGMREGQIVVVNNSAPVAHNVNWTGSRAKNPGSNVIVAAGQKHTIGNLKADNTPVTVKCDIHTWMRGWIRVFDHPYFTVTDADGNFEIKLPPAGKYQIWYWHDTGFKDGAAGNKGFPLEIKMGADTDLGKVDWKPAG